MPSVCEIKIELKKQGIKGITGKNKAELERLLKSGKSDVKPKEKKPDKKAEPKKPESKVKDIIKKFEKKAEPKKEPKKPLLLKFKEEQEEQNNLATKSYIYLKRKIVKIKAMVDDISTTGAEKENAKRLLKKYEDAMIKAKEKQYGNKKKNKK